jgi:hypothetical protein
VVAHKQSTEQRTLRLMVCERPPRRFAPPLLYQEGSHAHRNTFRDYSDLRQRGIITSSSIAIFGLNVHLEESRWKRTVTSLKADIDGRCGTGKLTVL